MFDSLLDKLKRTPTPLPAKGFIVDDVEPAKRAIWTETLAVSLNKRFRRQVLLVPEPDRLVANVLMESLAPAVRLLAADKAVVRTHPLIHAVHTAFSQHRPLTLSPDCIWMVIAQGFSHHITENAEALRHRLVRHQGRKTLTEAISAMTLDEFERVIGGFSSQIRSASDPVLHETLVCDFSTTTPGIRTASEVVLMDTYSSYFEYELRFVCGIPKIEITGSVEDWERIRARLEVLETYDLSWWIPRVRPLVDQFISAAAGQPDRQFWKAIFSPREVYAATIVTGWIADLFPYLGEAPHRQRNPVLQHARHNWAVTGAQGVGNPNWRSGACPATSSFPSGLSSVPIKLTGVGEGELGLDLVGGFLALDQDSASLALSPWLGWCLTERTPETPVII